MMQTVDHGDGASEYRGEQGAGSYIDRMRQKIAIQAPHVVLETSGIGVEMLLQRTPSSDREDLVAPANPENGQIILDGAPRQDEFHLITPRINVAQKGVGILSIPFGAEVVPTREQQTVQH